MPIENDNGEGTYIGEQLDGKRHGHGTFTLNNGTKFVGTWKNNLRDGEMVEYKPNGKSKKTVWVNGK